MQPDSENRFYRQLANELRLISRQSGIKLTAYSERLLVFATEAWFEDRTPSNLYIPRETGPRRRLAVRIFVRALKDPHVIQEMERDGSVSSSSLWVSISDAAKEILTKGA